MNGNIHTNRLHPKTGCYVSELDFDSRLGGSGLFVMVILPRECNGSYYGSDEDTVAGIDYKREEGGYRVDGEAYIVSGANAETIERKANRIVGNWRRGHSGLTVCHRKVEEIW